MVSGPDDADAIDFAGQLASAHHACCCSAAPIVVVVLPPTRTREQPIDLLLCGHHYRASQAGFAAARARVFDRNGVLAAEPGRPFFASSTHDAPV